MRVLARQAEDIGAYRELHFMLELDLAKLSDIVNVNKVLIKKLSDDALQQIIIDKTPMTEVQGQRETIGELKEK